jgi:hypothetical protein
MIKPYTLNVLRRDGVTTVELFEEREAAHAASFSRSARRHMRRPST